MAAPFIKWAGGKARLAPLIAELAPRSFGRYHEPFVGGGAVFFRLFEAGRSLDAVLNDLNGDLADAYCVVRDDIDALVSRLRELESEYLPLAETERAAYYYALRSSEPFVPVERAARLIFLNKTCYNGLYRVNKSGRFNVPHGDYARPTICDEAVLLAASEALHRVEVTSVDFEKACALARPGDLVYLDPPYQPMSATSSFTSYTSREFGEDEQRRLADAFTGLTNRGVFAILSNSDHSFVESLYGGFEVQRVSMARFINSVGSGRSPIAELLISNITQVHSRFSSSPK